MLLYFNQDAVIGGAEWSDVLFTLVWTPGISIILHGLYDTLLKQELEISCPNCREASFLECYAT